KMGWMIDQVHQLTNIDPWFLAEMKELVDFEEKLVAKEPTGFRAAKRLGYSDVQLSAVQGRTPSQIRDIRKNFGVLPVYKLVDSCPAELEASTPYYYSTYEEPYIQNGKRVDEDEIRLTHK